MSRRIKGVVFRHEAVLLDASTMAEKEYVVGRLLVTARFPDDTHTWAIPHGAAVPAIGSTVEIEVPS